MDSLAFLEGAGRSRLLPIYVLHGDEDFLKRRALEALRTLILGAEGEAFGLSTHAGDKATLAAVQDELQTPPFLGERRLVIVENADPFVTRFRAALETYTAKPAAHAVLVLEVRSWPASTKLAKLLSGDATIVCKAPPAYKLPDWCVAWVAAQHAKQLAAPAARLLVDLVGADMGLLDQELTKLAIYVGTADRIEAGDVDKLVGSSRAENTWKIFDAIAAGQSAEALAILERLLDQGEEPIRILGAFSLQLRRLAQAARLCEQGAPLSVALEQVGIPPFGRKSSEQQLRHLGRRRADRLYDWLLEVDLGLKGSSQLPPRIVLERLVILLARPNEPSNLPWRPARRES
jgi:DNA polymerase-3 subunit delta